MNYMPAFGAIYDDRQIADLVAYVRGAYSTRTAWPDAQNMAGKLRQEDDAR
jgi:mono/diheme cytochrome c family protein